MNETQLEFLQSLKAEEVVVNFSNGQFHGTVAGILILPDSNPGVAFVSAYTNRGLENYFQFPVTATFTIHISPAGNIINVTF